MGVHLRSLMIVGVVVVIAAVLGYRERGGRPDIAPNTGRAERLPTYGCPNANAIPTNRNRRAIERSTLCLLNAERRRHHRRHFAEETRLEAAARSQARDMLRRHFFAHVNPDGRSPGDRIRAAGWRGPGIVGENLAFGERAGGTPAEIVDGWMHSPGHRANILRGRFTQIGVAVEPEPVRSKVPRAAGGTYVTTFGGPPSR